MSPTCEREIDPYLPEKTGALFDRWLEETRKRFSPPLSFPDLRKGVRALSSLYVERRAQRDLSARALDGPARRAAFASYYAPLHLLTAYHACQALCAEGSVKASRIVDLGCGSGAAGAGVALALCPDTQVLAIDRSGWALSEARRTFRAFGLRARTRRGAIPESLPRLGPGDLVVLGWVVNELPAEGRDVLFAKLPKLAARGVRVLIFEALAGFVSPWRDQLKARDGGAVLREDTFKARVRRPEWIQRLDLAAGLDHRQLGARVWRGPLP